MRDPEEQKLLTQTDGPAAYGWRVDKLTLRKIINYNFSYDYLMSDIIFFFPFFLIILWKIYSPSSKSGMMYHPTLVPVGTLSPPPPGYDPSDYRVLPKSQLANLNLSFRLFQQSKSAKFAKRRFQTTVILKSTLAQAEAASIVKQQRHKVAQFKVWMIMKRVLLPQVLSKRVKTLLSMNKFYTELRHFIFYFEFGWHIIFEIPRLKTLIEN